MIKHYKAVHYTHKVVNMQIEDESGTSCPILRVEGLFLAGRYRSRHIQALKKHLCVLYIDNMSGAWLIISSNSGLQPRHSESESGLLLHRTMGTVQEKIERCNRSGYPQSKKKSRGCLPDPVQKRLYFIRWSEDQVVYVVPATVVTCQRQLVSGLPSFALFCDFMLQYSCMDISIVERLRDALQKGVEVALKVYPQALRCLKQCPSCAAGSPIAVQGCNALRRVKDETLHAYLSTTLRSLLTIASNSKTIMDILFKHCPFVFSGLDVTDEFFSLRLKQKASNHTEGIKIIGDDYNNKIMYAIFISAEWNIKVIPPAVSSMRFLLQRRDTRDNIDTQHVTATTHAINQGILVASSPRKIATSSPYRRLSAAFV
ncbi:hypothetical protein KCU74_g131, partial [Aureobasidium melanogenum]